MNKRVWLLSVLLPFVLGMSANAQSVAPKIIDCHIHYNGDPEFLQKLLSKLASVDGLAFPWFLLPTSRPPSR